MRAIPCTPNGVIGYERRTAAAKKALGSFGGSIKQVAEACGFSDLYYFSKVFKNETGVSPTEFRRNNV